MQPSNLIRIWCLTCAFCTALFSLSLPAQDRNEESDERMIQNRWIKLNFDFGTKKIVKLPTRKYDSPMFCHELTPWRSGFIINAITSNPGRHIEVNTKYYHIDTTSWSLTKLNYDNADTIESIISIGRDSIALCYIVKGVRQIRCIQNGKTTTLLDAASGNFAMLDSASWVKLTFHDSKIYALTSNGLAYWDITTWKLITSFDLDQFYLQSLGYRRSMSILPTLQPKISSGNIWFMQEVVQQRTANLLFAHIKTGKLNELYSSIGYRDNYEREVFTYNFISDGELIVTTSRLMHNFMINRVNKGTDEVWLFGNSIQTPRDTIRPVPISAARPYNGMIFLAGYNGMMVKTEDTVKSLISWNNGHQEVESIDWEFVPRCIEPLANERFLVGGLWGGLYIVDTKKQMLTPVDEIEYDKVKIKNIE